MRRTSIPIDLSTPVDAVGLSPADRASAIVQLHASILQRIAQREPLPGVLNALMVEIEALAPGMLASILLLDEDGAHLRHGAGPSLPTEYNAAVDGIAAAEGNGSCGTAAHRRAPVVVADLAVDPLWHNFRELALEHGLRSCWSTPILTPDGRVLGTFAIYYRTPRSPEPAHLELIDAAVHLARTAIEHTSFAERLQHMADHDPLTGLANRRRLEEELERHAAITQRYGPQGALLLLDIDHFKYVNDALGHSGGDMLIVSVANLLRQRLRATDTLARLGGDEFAVLLARADAQEATVVAEQLVAAIAENRVTVAGQERSMTTSIGVAPVDVPGTSAADLLIRADLAMYEAKEAGRNQAVTLMSDRLAEAPSEVRVTWVERIHHALTHEGFELYAQPVLPLIAGGPHFELLLRLKGDDGQAIRPGEFMPIAERLDLVRELDRWAIGRAMDLLERAQEDVSLEVNLSGRSIGDPGVLDVIERRLAAGSVDASRLIFEVTETGAVQNFQRALAFAQRLGHLGCRFALDDFGAGFGSFYYLKHLPFDFLKIDGEFVRNAVDNHVDRLVVDAVVHIAHALDKRAIAECVENTETAELLRAHGVDYLQGYAIGHPQPAETLIPMRPV